MTSQSFNEDSLTDAEYEIYQYLLNTDISNLTAGEIAKHFFVGRTMIYRVCQKMGFHTFTELKYSRQQEQADDFELSIEQLNTQISFSHLHPIALEIRGANRVFLYGTIASTIATEYFERQLINLGCFAVQINDRFQFEQRARGFTKGDVLVCISSSGKNTDIAQSQFQSSPLLNETRHYIPHLVHYVSTIILTIISQEMPLTGKTYFPYSSSFKRSY
mgnify:CR=1 FL=1